MLFLPFDENGEMALSFIFCERNEWTKKSTHKGAFMHIDGKSYYIHSAFKSVKEKTDFLFQKNIENRLSNIPSS